MRNSVKILAAALVAALAVPAMAGNGGNSVLVTSTRSGGGLAIAMDITGDSKATGFQFRVKVPGSDSAKANTAKCLSQLPSGWTGGCTFKEGVLRVAAFSTAGQPLPDGVIGVGTVTVSGGALAKGSAPALEVFNIEFADANGNALPHTSQVEGDQAHAK